MAEKSDSSSKLNNEGEEIDQQKDPKRKNFFLRAAHKVDKRMKGQKSSSKANQQHSSSSEEYYLSPPPTTISTTAWEHWSKEHPTTKPDAHVTERPPVNPPPGKQPIKIHHPSPEVHTTPLVITSETSGVPIENSPLPNQPDNTSPPPLTTIPPELNILDYHTTSATVTTASTTGTTTTIATNIRGAQFNIQPSPTINLSDAQPIKAPPITQYTPLGQYSDDYHKLEPPSTTSTTNDTTENKTSVQDDSYLIIGEETIGNARQDFHHSLDFLEKPDDTSPVNRRPQTAPIRDPKIAKELAKVEIERDKYKDQAKSRKKQLKKYEEELLYYRAQAKFTGVSPNVSSSTHSDTAVNELKRQLEESNDCIFEIEREKNNKLQEWEKEKKELIEKHDELLKKEKQDSSTTINQLKQEKKQLATDKQGLEQSHDDHLKEIETLQESLAKGKGKLKLMEKRFHEIDKAHNDQVEENEKLKTKLANLNTTAQQTIKQAKEREEEWKEKFERSEKQRKEKAEVFTLQQQTINELKEQLKKKDETTLAAKIQAATETEEKEKLKKQLKEKKREVDHAVIQATIGKEKQEEELKAQLKEKWKQEQDKMKEQINTLNQQLKQMELSETQLKEKQKEHQQNVQFEIEEKNKYKKQYEQLLAVQETNREEMRITKDQLLDVQAIEQDLRRQITQLHEKIPHEEEGASAGNSFSEEDKAKRELEQKMQDLDETKKQLEVKLKDYEDQLATLEADHRKREGALINTHREELTELLRKHKRQEKLIKDMNEELKEKGMKIIKLNEEIISLKEEKQELHGVKDRTMEDLTTHKQELQRFKERNEELVSDLSHKEVELTDMRDRLEEKGQVIEKLQAKVDEHSQAVDERKQTVKNMKNQLENQMKKAEEEKLKAVTELVDKIQVLETQCAIFKADFEGERNDRQRIHHELTEQLEEVKAKLTEAKENFHILQHNNEQTTQVLNKSIEELKGENEILTAQVNAHYERGEEIKRELTKSKDKRIELENEITKLKAEIIKLKKSVDPLTETAERAKNQFEELQSLRTQLVRLKQAGSYDTAKLTEELATARNSIERLNEELSANRQELKDSQQSVIKLNGQLATTKQQLDSVTFSKESLLLSYQNEKASADDLESKVKELRDMNDRLKRANEVLKSRVTGQPINVSSQVVGQTHPQSNVHVPPPGSHVQQENLQQSSHRGGQFSNESSKNHSSHIASRRNHTLMTSSTDPQYVTKAEQVDQNLNGKNNEFVVAGTQGSQSDNYSHNNSEPSETPVMTQEDIARMFAYQKQPQQQTQYNTPHDMQRQQEDQKRQQQEKERKRLREEADKALRELDEARQGEHIMTKRSPKVSRKPYPVPPKKSKGNNIDDHEPPIEENLLIQNIDKEIQEAAQWVYDQSRRPPTAEVEAVSDEEKESTLPYDPNLICPKCGKRYHIGGIQLFKRHVTELCPLLEK